MKKEFEMAELEVSSFSVEDVVTTSGDVVLPDDDL